MKNFNEIYENVLKSSKTELESLRRKNLYQIIIIVIILITLFVIVVNTNNQIMKLMIGVIIVLSPILNYHSKSSYRTVYKESVVKTFIKNYDEHLEYEPLKGIDTNIYKQGQFEGYDEYYSEDLIVGYIDEHKISIAEVHTQNESEDSDGKKTYSTVFHGLFGVCKFNNSYNGAIKIRSNKKLLGKIFEDKKRKIEMDSSQFEKHFDVYADDQIQAMQLLTSDIMNMMIEFIEQSGIKFELTINHNKLYIRFKTGEMFEGNMFKSSVDFDTLKKTYDVINFTFDITKALIKVIEETQV